ncbi:MAG TPA: ABC transporter substrate-binding protein [Tissierellaceae bacterium]|nr:ABC transporter substrate-binding protein [Tissierellaceae bacterium]
MMRNRRRFIKVLVIVLIASLIVVTGCSSDDTSAGGDKTIIFADAGWDSIKLHNEIAGFIIENGYGFKTDVLPGSSAATFAGFRRGDIDVYMEAWTDNLIEIYGEAIESGDIVEVSINFDDNAQGLYVPTVMIEGDPENGIEPVAPDLVYMTDLPQYWELFQDPEEPTKGRIYGAPPGWNVDNIMQTKVDTYDLDGTFNYFSPGSDTALSTSLAAAAQKGDAWVGYYWEPTWVLGKYDMTLLLEEPYDKDKWENGYGSSFPPMPVTVCVYKDLEEEAPDVYGFLENYETSSEITNKALAFMQDTDADTQEAAMWFFEEYEELWKSWIPSDIAEKVSTALNK